MASFRTQIAGMSLNPLHGYNECKSNRHWAADSWVKTKHPSRLELSSRIDRTCGSFCNTQK